MLLLLLSLSLLPPTLSLQPTTHLPTITLHGLSLTPSIHAYLGIPFASPPLGPLRLQQAVPLKGNLGDREAKTFGHACYNAGGEGDPSEDCLTLNVWMPVGEDMEGLPVLVWVYGGGLVGGWSVSLMILTCFFGGGK